MEKSFEIDLPLKEGTCDESVVKEYHCGLRWEFFAGFGKYAYFHLACLEDIAQRFPLGFLVEADVELWVALGDERICIATKSGKFTRHTDMTVEGTLEKGLQDRTAHSDTTYSARVKIKRTFGCRCDTLENFEKPKAFWTDRRLVVEGKQFHVNQAYLAHKSQIFKTLFLDNPSKEIIIDNTNSDAFEIFMQITHKKAPSFPVQLVPQIIELGIRFEIGLVREYCEWYMVEYGVWLLDLEIHFEHDIYNVAMKRVFPEYDFGAFLKKWNAQGTFLYLNDCKFRTSIQCRSTMEENFRKAVTFVIPVEISVIPTLRIGESVTEAFIISGKKEHDFFGLHWTVEVDPQNMKCHLKCDEGYWEKYYYEEFHGAPPGWFITVDVNVFEVIEDQKTLVGTKKNGTYASLLELVEVDLYSEFDWKLMPSEDAKFEVHVKIVRAAGTRHLTLEDFSEEKEGWTDGCLVVQGRQFHINKKNLARNSEYFADIFNNKPGSVVRQFHVVDEDADLFEHFLQIAHSGSSFIKKNDILGLVDLATRYKSKIVMEACRTSIMYHFIDLMSDWFTDFANTMEQLDCSDMWEVKVEHPLFDDIDDYFVGHQGLNAMFPKLLELKSKDLCWPIFIESSSGEVYILKWDLNSSLESLIKTVANIENKPITSQQLMIDGVLVENELDIIANFHLPSAEKCEETTCIPDVYKDLIDGTAEGLEPELCEDFENFLLDCSELGLKNRLVLADKYSLQKLLKKCFADILRLDQMYQFIEYYPAMSLPVKKKLYEVAKKCPSSEFMWTYEPPRFPKFYVEIDSEDTGRSVAARIGRIRGLPPCKDDVIDFNEWRGRERMWYNAWEIQRIQSINTDVEEE